MQKNEVLPGIEPGSPGQSKHASAKKEGSEPEVITATL
jgi:hypothetical protein